MVYNKNKIVSKKKTNKIILNKNRKNKNTNKKGGNYSKEEFLKSKNQIKQQLEEQLQTNMIRITNEISKIKENSLNSTYRNNSPIKLSIKKKSFFDSILSSFPNLQSTSIYLFIVKIIVCVFLLPLMKHNFNFQNALSDMLRNLFETIFNIEFFKNNFTSIIALLDKLGTLYEPYKYLKKLLEDIDKKNEETSSGMLKTCFNSFINYDTLIKINIIVTMYKNREKLFNGNAIENTQDSISVISCILTVFELIICPQNNYTLCSYISPWNNISIYLLYFITSIDMAVNVYKELCSDSPEIKEKIEKYGYFPVVLFVLCSNINFYKEGQLISPVKIQTQKKIIKKKEEKEELENNKIITNSMKANAAWFFIKLPFRATGAVISNPYVQMTAAAGASAYLIKKIAIDPTIDNIKNKVTEVRDESFAKVDQKIIAWASKNIEGDPTVKNEVGAALDTLAFNAGNKLATGAKTAITPDILTQLSSKLSSISFFRKTNPS